MSDLNKNLEKAATEALQEGFTVIRGDNLHLLLDLDSTTALSHYEKQVVLVAREFAAQEEARWRSKSGNWHVLMKLGRSLSTEARIALQAALGSDPVREILAIRRCEEGVLNPIALFKPGHDESASS